MVVTLIGYRGSSKSTLAPRLAELWGCPWIDADVEIERRAGQTIREIFACEGEAGFRDRERQVLADLLATSQPVEQAGLVLAAGGGAVLDKRNRRLMHGAGPVLWLQASPETLFDRIQRDQTTGERRPNLAGGGLEEVRKILRLRQPLYAACATHVLDTEGLSADEVFARAWGILSGGLRCQ